MVLQIAVPIEWIGVKGIQPVTVEINPHKDGRAANADGLTT